MAEQINFANNVSKLRRVKRGIFVKSLQSPSQKHQIRQWTRYNFMISSHEVRYEQAGIWSVSRLAIKLGGATSGQYTCYDYLVIIAVFCTSPSPLTPTPFLKLLSRGRERERGRNMPNLFELCFDGLLRFVSRLPLGHSKISASSALRLLLI